MNTHRTTSWLTTLSVTLISTSMILCTGCSIRESAKEGTGFFRKILDKDTYSLYRPGIQQGNAITSSQFRRLKPGMTRQQVHYLLGDPITRNVFHKNRWNYYHYSISGTRKRKYNRLILFFEDDRLVRYRVSKELAARRKNRDGKKPVRHTSRR